MWEFFSENPAILATLLIALATGLFTIFIKTTITIFKMGAIFRAEYATKRDQITFEREMRETFKEYKDEVLKIVMSASMEMIRDKLKDVERIKNTEQDMRLLEKELQLKMTNVLDRIDETKTLSDNIRALNAKVDRIQYGQHTAPVRRKEE